MASAFVGLRFLRDPLSALDDLGRDERDVVPFRLGPRRLVLLKAPELIERLLARPDPRVTIGPMKGTARWFGGALISSEGESHDRDWDRAVEAFHGDCVLTDSTFVSYADELRGRWRAGEQVDIDTDMLALAFRMTWHTVFASDVEQEAPEARLLFARGMEMVPRLARPLAGARLALPLSSSRRFRTARGAAYDLLDRKLAASANGRGLHARFEDWNAEALDGRGLRDWAMSVIPAHAMMGPAFTWACVVTAQHSEVDARLHEEVARELDEDLPVPDDVDRLPYARAVFLESLRVYPAVWGIFRQLAGPLELAGVTAPARSLVLASQWVTHRDPRSWPDPHRFDADRWLQEPFSSYDGTFFPFGLGGRSCIADAMVMRTGPLILAMLVQRWRLRLASDAAPTFEAGVAVRPRDPIRLVVEPR